MPGPSHTYTAVIADDEEPARRRIRELLEKEEDIRLLEICKNGEQAIDSVQKLLPNILFLDVQMPEIGGFDVLKNLPREHIPITIFVTAYDQYALQAFEVHAVDYLLKPFSDERFSDALKRAKKRCEMENREPFHNRLDKLLSTDTEESHQNRKPDDSAYIDRIVLERNGKKFFLDVHQIRWVEASGSYIYVHTEEKKYIKRMLLGSLEKRLNPRYFIRIHRSAVVHLDAIESLYHYSHGDYKVTLSGGKELKLSRNYRNNLQNRLGQQL